MNISTEILEAHFRNFIQFLKANDEEFIAFKTSKYLNNPKKGENYKYAVYDEAREKLGNKRWKPEDIGSGKILAAVGSALLPKKIVYNNELVDNNLINRWTIKDNFLKIKNNKDLEQLLFNFYKSKPEITEKQVFEKLSKDKHPYNLIAYLFFLKDCQRYLPITQERFDEIFVLIGLPEFRTSGRTSWDNYTEFININKQTRDYLKTKDPNTTLLDAHSFLYFLGTQMKEAKFQLTSPIDNALTESENNNIESLKSDDGQSLEDNNEIDEEVHYNDEMLPEELPEEISEQLFEGAKKTITINAYERSIKARQRCIKHWKPVCAVCDFNFEERYGELGKGFIHVHHLTPVSQIGNTYEIDPINDLRPVCPNCHAMLHRQEKTLTIEELKLMMTTLMTGLASR